MNVSRQVNGVTPHMERASVNGVKLEYELKGSGEPLLLIHGSHIGRSFLPLLA
jgi:hypothetical protein